MNYKISLSNKSIIEIDQEDYQKFLAVAPTGSFVRLKRGIVNPSFVVSIEPCEVKPERVIDGYVDEVSGKFVVTQDTTVLKPLADAFDVTKQLHD